MATNTRPRPSFTPAELHTIHSTMNHIISSDGIDGLPSVEECAPILERLNKISDEINRWLEFDKSNARIIPTSAPARAHLPMEELTTQTIEQFESTGTELAARCEEDVTLIDFMSFEDLLKIQGKLKSVGCMLAYEKRWSKLNEPTNS